MAETAARNKRKALTGVVRKVSGAKTISVKVERRVKHPRYGKYLTRSINHLVHDEKCEAGAGDTVEIMACRPLSASKRWRLCRVVEKAPAGIVGRSK